MSFILKYSCSVCLEILIDPVALQCGHSYCLHCIRLNNIDRCSFCNEPIQPIGIKKCFMLTEILLELFPEEIKERRQYLKDEGILDELNNREDPERIKFDKILMDNKSRDLLPSNNLTKLQNMVYTSVDRLRYLEFRTQLKSYYKDVLDGDFEKYKKIPELSFPGGYIKLRRHGIVLDNIDYLLEMDKDRFISFIKNNIISFYCLFHASCTFIDYCKLKEQNMAVEILVKIKVAKKIDDKDINTDEIFEKLREYKKYLLR